MKIIIDTNFVISCVKQKIDIFSELDELLGKGIYELIVAEEVFDELKKINKDKNMKIVDREAAILGIEIFKKKAKIIELKTTDVDTGIVKYVNNTSENIILATLDKELKERVKNKNIKFLTIRNKKRLILE